VRVPPRAELIRPWRSFVLVPVTTTDLDRLDTLLALVRRCDRLISLQGEAVARSPELIRAVAELRVALSTDARHAPLERSLAVPTIDGLRLALVGVRVAFTQEQRRLLGRRAVA